MLDVGVAPAPRPAGLRELRQLRRTMATPVRVTEPSPPNATPGQCKARQILAKFERETHELLHSDAAAAAATASVRHGAPDSGMQPQPRPRYTAAPTAAPAPCPPPASGAQPSRRSRKHLDFTPQVPPSPLRSVSTAGDTTGGVTSGPTPAPLAIKPGHVVAGDGPSHAAHDVGCRVATLGPAAAAATPAQLCVELVQCRGLRRAAQGRAPAPPSSVLGRPLEGAGAALNRAFVRLELHGGAGAEVQVSHRLPAVGRACIFQEKPQLSLSFSRARARAAGLLP
jgi:hypothetical protein